MHFSITSFIFNQSIKMCQLTEAEWRICVSNPAIVGSDNGFASNRWQAIVWTTIGSDDGLAPTRWHAIIWTNAGILLLGPFRINFN